jgi:hypothetical protein
MCEQHVHAEVHRSLHLLPQRLALLTARPRLQGEVQQQVVALGQPLDVCRHAQHLRLRPEIRIGGSVLQHFIQLKLELLLPCELHH